MQYWSRAVAAGGKFVADRSWTCAKNVLFIKRLLKVETAKEWAQEVESWNEERVWDSRHKQAVALKKFAFANGRKVEDIELEDLPSDYIHSVGVPVSLALHVPMQSHAVIAAAGAAVAAVNAVIFLLK